MNPFKYLYDKYRDGIYEIRVRFFDKYHVINTGLPPGYRDTSERLLHGTFQLLVDYVEVELAWMQVVFSDDAKKKYKYPWFSIKPFRFKSFRCPEAGLDYLAWEKSLQSEDGLNDRQAEKAKVVEELYVWWKTIRPNRPDSMDASGWSAYCEERRINGEEPFSNKKRSEAEEDRIRKMIEEMTAIEKNYLEEDKMMWKKLVDIHECLWT